MLTISLRSGFRVVAVILALVCGWIAIATAQKAHVPVCSNPYHPHGPAVTVERPGLPRGRVVLCNRVHPAFRVTPVGTTWLVGPTLAMSATILAALVLALIAISPRQGSLLAYRWRRAVY